MSSRKLPLLILLACSSTAFGQDVNLLNGLKWRLIGPFRGGRSVAVAGTATRPNEFYFGATGGGLWKTNDAGTQWSCVSDGFFKTASVGAVAVAPSNPDIVYAGTGERDIRGDISHGDGVYKSVDAGKTWASVGLRDTQTISRICVDPKNPDMVFVAALGHVYGPNEERGVYKSTDGGKTWKRVLFESDRAGAVELVLDPSDSNTLYAATWEAWRTPYSLNSGGPGSKIYKSTDGGEHWQDLTRRPGLPTGVIGKIGLSVSPVDSKTVWAIVEALDGGIFRSKDAGQSWTRVNEDREWRQRAWYYTHIYADPKDVETVYVLNVGMGKSTDGGKTFNRMRTPHSDNHDLWISPTDPKRMIESNDGGANVSTDGGATWSKQEFPTGQFYHVTADNAFPYRILGAQQDSSSVRIASRTESGGIGRTDWTGTAGGESGYVTAKPNDPDVVFGGNYGGELDMLNHKTNQSRDVNPWPDNPMGHGAIDIKERFQWTFPIVFSPHDPNTLYTSSQHLFKSNNNGQSWKRISPDLTRNDPKTLQSSGGPITKDNTSVEYFGTIFTVAESPVKAGTIWTGSDDGLVQLTRDGGAHWTDVTPPAMPHLATVNMVESSPTKAGTAYIAVDNHENDDYRPYAYRTDDFGKTWTPIVGGLPNDTYVRVVREDPKRPGLLYAGTENGVFVSFDNGGKWQPLQMNLPLCPVHDLIVKDDDLVAATHGRAFWILDDLAPIRGLPSASGAYLFQPNNPYNVFWGGGFGGGGRDTGPTAQNPLGGLVLDYLVPEGAKTVKFEFLDSSGKVFSTREGAKDPGFHRASFPLNVPSYRSFPGMIMWAAFPSAISVPPGEYKVRMVTDKGSTERSFHLLNDPRSTATEADLRAQYELCLKIRDRVTEANDAVIQIRDVKKKISEAEDASKKDPAIVAAGDALTSKLSAVESEIYQVQNRSGQDPLNYPIKLNNRLAALLGVVQSGRFRPTQQSYDVFQTLSALLQPQLDAKTAIFKKDLESLNEKLKAANLKPIVPVDPATIQTAAPQRRGGGEEDEN